MELLNYNNYININKHINPDNENKNVNINLPFLPIYIQKYILLLICEYINNGSNISFNSFNNINNNDNQNGNIINNSNNYNNNYNNNNNNNSNSNNNSLIKEYNQILKNTSMVSKSFFKFIKNQLTTYYLENNNNFNYYKLININNNNNNGNSNNNNNSNNNKVISSNFKLYNNNQIEILIINFNNQLNQNHSTTDEINNMNMNNNGEILINNQTISNYHFIDYINEKIKLFKNLKKIKIISNSGCYYSKMNGVDDLNRIQFLGEIKVYRIVLRSSLMNWGRNRYQITIAEFIFKPNNQNNQIQQNHQQQQQNNQIQQNQHQHQQNNIIYKPIHSFKIKKIIHEYTNSMMVKDLTLGLFIYSINKSKEKSVVRESFTSLTYPFNYQDNHQYSFTNNLLFLNSYYSYILIILVTFIILPLIYYK